MPWKKIECPLCSGPMSHGAKACRNCRQPGSYTRTQATRDRMSRAMKGRQQRGTGWSHSEETKAKMRSKWTPERRARHSQLLLAKNPGSRYHGLSARAAKAICEAAGECSRCGETERLNVHHIDRNKRNQAKANLDVLCCTCHQHEHSDAKETGWAAYWAKRRS